MDPSSNEKRDSRGGSLSSTSPAESTSGPSGSGVMRRRGSLFELVTGRPEPASATRNLSGSDNAINTRHRAAGVESRLKATNPFPLPQRRPSGVTIIRPTKEARKAEIVAAVTRRLYTARKKPELRPELPPSLTEGAEESDQSEPKELQLCSNARARLQEISKRAIALGLHRKLRKDSDTQTEEMKCALRVKEKSVCTDEPTKEIAVETVSTSIEANLSMDFGKRVEIAEKSSQWKAESMSVGTQSMPPPLPPPLCHYFPPPVCSAPFWMNPWWPNLSWGMGCCHHDTKRRANISAVDSAEEAFSDDSLESLCGLSRVPDGSSGDSGIHEQKPTLWETLTLRSGSHFKDNPSLYQPDVFKTHPLSSIFPKQISYLGKEDKSTETESPKESDNETTKLKEVGCNTDQMVAIFDEAFPPPSCPIHSKRPETSTENQATKPYSFRLADPQVPTPARFQVVCDFTVACHPFQGQDPANLTLKTHVRPDDSKWSSGCTCRHDPAGNEGLYSDDRRGVASADQPMLTAVPPEVFTHEHEGNVPLPSSNQRSDNPGTTKSDQKYSPSTVTQPETPFSTPDIIAQARDESKIGDARMAQAYREDERHSPPDPKLDCKAGESSGSWTGGERDYTSLDSSLLHQRSNQPEDPFRAKSFESIFQRQNNPDGKSSKEHNRSTSNTVKKFRLPYLSEIKNQPSSSALVTARAVDEPRRQPSPPRTNNTVTKPPPKRITPTSFLSPNGRRLLLTWLNNPGSSPPSSASKMKPVRKTVSGKVTRRHIGFRDKSQKKSVLVGANGSASSRGKVLIYHNLSLLLSEATNYMKTLTKRSELRDKQEENKENKSHAEFATQAGLCDCSLQSENRRMPTEATVRNLKGSDKVQLNPNSSKTKSSNAATQTYRHEIEKPSESVRTKNLGTQCDLTSRTNEPNSFIPGCINRCTQTDVFLWNDFDLQEPLVSEEPFQEPVPYFCPTYHERLADLPELPLDETSARNFGPIASENWERSQLFLPPDDWTYRSRLPCQHSSPRLYLQHLVSLRKGVVEASQSPARPTGVG